MEEGEGEELHPPNSPSSYPPYFSSFSLSLSLSLSPSPPPNICDDVCGIINVLMFLLNLNGSI